MLSPRLGLSLEAKKPGLGLDLDSIMALASFHLASKPRFTEVINDMTIRLNFDISDFRQCFMRFI